MGRMAAEGMAEMDVPLDAVPAWHLQSNHYPPLPMEYVDVAKRVIEWVGASDPYDDATWSEMIDLPAGINPLPRDAQVNEEGVMQVSVGTLVEILHLDSYIDWEG